MALAPPPHYSWNKGGEIHIGMDVHWSLNNATEKLDEVNWNIGMSLWVVDISPSKEDFLSTLEDAEARLPLTFFDAARTIVLRVCFRW